MMDVTIHFVKNSPESQEKGEIPVIPIIDGHTSKLKVRILLYFMTNNVYSFIPASYTSI